MAYSTSTLTGTYHTFDGQPASGVVEIIPNSRQLVDAEGDVILAGRVKVTLDEAGSFSVSLPATDDATVEPATGRQYTVVAKLRHTHLAAVTGVELATGATVDVADVASAPVVDPAVSLAATTAQLAALEADVDAALALKADADDVTAALAGKQDAGDYATTTALTTGLAGKADTADLPTAPEDIGAEPAGLSAATEAALSATFVSMAAAPTGTAPADAAAITAAINALPATGGTVVLQRGTYVGRFAVAKDNVTLQGQGKGVTTLKLNDGNTSGAQTLTIAADRVTVEGLTIDGNKANQTIPTLEIRQSDGISIYGSHCHIDKCEVVRATGHGIIVWNEATSGHGTAANAARTLGVRDGNKITNSLFSDNGHGGDPRSTIDIATDDDNSLNVVAFNTIYQGATSSSAITMHSGSRTLILGNMIETVGVERAMMIHAGSRGCRVIGNIVRAATGTDGALYMIAMTNAYDCLVSGNFFETNRGTSALIRGDQVMSNVAMTDNTVRPSAAKTDNTLIAFTATTTLTGITGRGNRMTNQTGTVSGTAAQKAAVRVTDHYIDGALAVADHDAHAWRSGNWYAPPGLTVNSTRALSNGQVWATPLIVPRACSLDRLAVELTAAGTGSATVRLGLYGSTADGAPGALVVDGGTVAATTTGAKEVTIAADLQPGLYFVAVVGQGATSSPTARAAGGVSPAVGAATAEAAIQANATAWLTTSGSVTGALPATLTLNYGASSAPYPAVRVV